MCERFRLNKHVSYIEIVLTAFFRLSISISYIHVFDIIITCDLPQRHGGQVLVLVLALVLVSSRLGWLGLVLIWFGVGFGFGLAVVHLVCLVRVCLFTCLSVFLSTTPLTELPPATPTLAK